MIESQHFAKSSGNAARARITQFPFVALLGRHRRALQAPDQRSDLLTFILHCDLSSIDCLSALGPVSSFSVLSVLRLFVGLATKTLLSIYVLLANFNDLLSLVCVCPGLFAALGVV